MKATLLLENRWDEIKRQQHPTIPSHAIPRTKFSDRTANGLGKCLRTYSILEKFQCERISTEGRVIDSRKTVQDCIGRRKVIGSLKRIPTSGIKGSADYSLTINGRSVKVEIKIGKDRQSPAQKEYQRQVEAAGGIYLLISSFQEFYDWFQQQKGASL